jgi:hypothetical protein
MKISNDNKTMWFVLTFSHKTSTGTQHFGQIKPEMRWGDKNIQFDGDGITVTGLFDPADIDNGGFPRVDNKISGKVKVWCYSGGSNFPLYGAPVAYSTQVLGNTSIKADSVPWDSTYKMEGLMFAVVQVTYDSEKGTTGLPSITARIQNTLTNPGEVLKDYMLNQVYGCQLTESAVDTVALDAITTFSNNQLTYSEVINGVTTVKSGPRYQVNGVIDTASPVISNLLEIIETCDGWLNYDEVNAKWKVILNQSYQEQGKTLNDLFTIYGDSPMDNTNSWSRSARHTFVTGDINYMPGDLNEYYNKVQLQYTDHNILDQKQVDYIDLPDNLRNPNEPARTLNLQFTYIKK